MELEINEYYFSQKESKILFRILSDHREKIEMYSLLKQASEKIFEEVSQGRFIDTTYKWTDIQFMYMMSLVIERYFDLDQKDPQYEDVDFLFLYMRTLLPVQFVDENRQLFQSLQRERRIQIGP